ncbi:hypothetical protein V1477_004717 [Vespula maculifrons]|uniref:Uncharacterized protein n=1 Tax=Vespula maculifrons TaxID=7453 RepID=A0ABD2CMP2_VESMC
MIPKVFDVMPLQPPDVGGSDIFGSLAISVYAFARKNEERRVEEKEEKEEKEEEEEEEEEEEVEEEVKEEEEDEEDEERTKKKGGSTGRRTRGVWLARAASPRFRFPALNLLPIVASPSTEPSDSSSSFLRCVSISMASRNCWLLGVFAKEKFENISSLHSCEIIVVALCRVSTV